METTRHGFVPGVGAAVPDTDAAAGVPRTPNREPCDPDRLSFCVFMLHKLAENWKMSVPKTYGILVESGIFDNYLLNHYETLHTLGAEYLTEDITEFAREKGAAV
ncbi:MAG: DUF3791 domain-containing protein [Verrucomicrobiota bacterium]|jgi:hypothetical protein|nr:DUF3791 domain-containing protein [Verrucomicrobiota bacterium]